MYLGLSRAQADDTGYRGSDEGGKLKETGTTYWNSPNTGATNETGFSARGSGFRTYQGEYQNLGIGADWWTSTENGTTNGWFHYVGNEHADIGRFGVWSKTYGLSVRCIKD